MNFQSIIEYIAYNILWGLPLVITCIGVGIFFTIRTGGFQFKYLWLSLKTLFSKSDDDNENGTIKPLEAVSIAIGATVGVGNIGGVAAAMAIGGPGALFWLWVAGIFGMIVKMVEVTLAVHYRKTSENGETIGGPTYYMERGIAKQKNLKTLAKILMIIFVTGYTVSFFVTMQNYTISESISSTFNVSMILVSAIFTLMLYFMIVGGLKKLGKIAATLVPFMCIFYIAGGLFIIATNITELPGVLQMVFVSAFNGKAAIGGFAGAGIVLAIKTGVARSVYSNEAGWGSSPMIHASAKTSHPIKQGILGIAEVFFDTMVVCTITALIVLVTGEWTAGSDVAGATLTLNAFESTFGNLGRILLTVGVFLFGITTSSGIFVQMRVIVEHIVSDNNKNKETIMNLFKWIYPIPAFLLVVVAVVNELPGGMVWLFADITVALPVFANLIAITILSGTFLKLLKDFKARYLDKGEIDNDIILFYEDE